MRKLAILIAITVLLVTVVPVVANGNGFDEFGYNYGARLFNGWDGYCDRSIEGGWIPGTNDSVLVMKWSKDWIPMADETVGAWCTNHFTWYSNDYDEATWYGWDTRVPWSDAGVSPEAKYKIEEFMKIMKVGDDATAWAEYQAGGAFDAGWGVYDPSGVPKYVVFQDTLKVYERSWNLLGNWVLSFNYGGKPYVHDMVVGTQADGSFSGTGGYPSGGAYSHAWIVTGTVSGDTVNFHIIYLTGNPGYEVTVIGSIASNGSMSGTWSSNAGQNGTWTSTAGSAIASYDDLIAGFNLATTSPKGLGQPIF